ncbi:MAG: quinol dehydrogenase ferredoxin subunit NapH [Gammaproteobacteria bacterium]|nr:quinol dehydrogenase ferredoxin subunit NapH [Gammaproteobacteria bacterium]
MARRLSQFGILALFLAGPWFGVWLVAGNLSSSRTLGVLELTDPYVFVQSLAAGHLPAAGAVVGAAIVLGFYVLVGGRSYCAWVCPVNVVTDTAGWLRRRLRLPAGARLARATRYWLLAMTLSVAALTGTLAWELINPVSLLHRGLIFGMGWAWAVVASVFLFDLAVSDRGWCAHLCPMGAFYGLVGAVALVRVRAEHRARCDDCGDCYVACPEPQVIAPALKGGPRGVGPVIRAGACSNCARCIDVCSKDVFSFGTRFNNVASGSRKGRHDEPDPAARAAVTTAAR